jgi:hypothetical protein
MPRIDKKVLLNMSVNKVYDILNDFLSLPVWNIVVTEASEIEKDVYFFKTNVGEVTNYVIENIPMERMTSRQEGDSPMQKIGYIFNPKGDKVEVTMWAEFELEDQISVLEIAADMFLKSLKVYTEHILSGGDPKVYRKRFGKISKATLES